MVAAGNRSEATTSSSNDDSGSGSREYSEMPIDYLVDATQLPQDGDDDDTAAYKKLVCDPMIVNCKYRSEIGNELCALWSLLFNVLSHSPGLVRRSSSSVRMPVEGAVEKKTIAHQVTKTVTGLHKWLHVAS
ncbi:hypothetical protein PC116_g5445 [Phytophthora cactorum]|uniref:Uncharacterized protein n=1 Tax=Phytophthora cactorum TaxID=29920 RepID=A0A329R769_9STRA|nr:hypothetical protein PC111_g24489 [Phytophthora cactorum]KAG2875984.1 hypothetical protein PC117_g27334 [Phytophthora cactorum]KAG2957406.1 hypothetical protein PC119_g27337 [Phytophthora cactorum]KAG2964211.1 hypothetical protein PC120_g27416 [Phytophthora cactorum]KAG3030187.1 hypothetical protein PC121_g24515 [Phytophthora cactorum]